MAHWRVADNVLWLDAVTVEDYRLRADVDIPLHIIFGTSAVADPVGATWFTSVLGLACPSQSLGEEQHHMVVVAQAGSVTEQLPTPGRALWVMQYAGDDGLDAQTGRVLAAYNEYREFVLGSADPTYGNPLYAVLSWVTATGVFFIAGALLFGGALFAIRRPNRRTSSRHLFWWAVALIVIGKLTKKVAGWRPWWHLLT